MRKMKLIILLTLISLSVIAPPAPFLAILVNEEIRPYEAIIRAVNGVESGHGKYMYNAKENAVGEFGIRPIRVKDYNMRTGKNITLDQCYDYETSKMIFLYYASQFHPSDIKGICINWNGVSVHNKYYQRIKAEL